LRLVPHIDVPCTTLAEAGGMLPYHDKSSSEEIREAFGVSKKAFKQAVGALCKL